MKRCLVTTMLGLVLMIGLGFVFWCPTSLAQGAENTKMFYTFDISDVVNTEYGYGLSANLLVHQEDGSWLQTESVGQIIDLVPLDYVLSGEFDGLGAEWLLTATYEAEVLTVVLFFLVDEENHVYQEIKRVDAETQTSYVLPTLNAPEYRIIAMETEDGVLNQLYGFDGATWRSIGDPWIP